MNYQQVFHDVYHTVDRMENKGNVATYIPDLAKVNPDQFGAAFLSTAQEEYGLGDWQKRFSIQSISKVLSLSLAYNLLGDSIWERVGVEPSGDAFNSLVQLKHENGIPRNPFINSGAIVICDMLISNLKDPKNDFLDYVRKIGSNVEIDYCPFTAKSEEEFGYRNKALCNFIKSFDNIENEPSQVLDFYFYMCSILMSCQELTKTFIFLANSNCCGADGTQLLSQAQAKRINALMQTCGFYDESGDFSFRVGLPGKSGVGGGIVAIYPGNYCIAVWSPKLNDKGNSYKGMKFLELFTTETKHSIF